MATRIKVTMTNAEELARIRGLDKNGRLQKMLTSEIYRRSDAYTPMQSSVLKSQVDVGSDYVHYRVPHARYQWYGKVMVGPAPRRVTSKDLQYNGSPRRGKEWVLRMWKDHGKAVLQSIAKEGGMQAK